MHKNPVLIFEDEIIEKRKRIVHVFEDVTATITAWHGDEQLSSHSSLNNADSAIEEAEGLCKRYGVTPKASLHFRVDVKKERSYRTLLRDGKWPEYDSKRAKPCLTILRRHVWDSHVGKLETNRAFADFEILLPVGMKPEDDPGAALIQLLDSVEPQVDQDMLWDGFGVGEATIDSCVRVEFDGLPPKPDRADRNVSRWANLLVRGRLGLEVPIKMSAKAVLKHLESVDLNVRIDWAFLDGIAHRLVVYSGAPAARFTVNYPAAIEMEIVAPLMICEVK